MPASTHITCDSDTLPIDSELLAEEDSLIKEELTNVSTSDQMKVRNLICMIMGRHVEENINELCMTKRSQTFGAMDIAFDDAMLAGEVSSRAPIEASPRILILFLGKINVVILRRLIFHNLLET